MARWEQATPLSDDISAVVHVESRGNPNAVSPKGARGTMQVMPGTNTQPGYGVIPARDDSEGERARVGEDYLSTLQQKYGREGGLRAYNMGPGAYEKYLAGRRGLPAETAAYVPLVNKAGGKPAAQSGAQPRWMSATPDTGETVEEPTEYRGGSTPGNPVRIEVSGVGVNPNATGDSSPPPPVAAQSKAPERPLVESLKHYGKETVLAANDLMTNVVTGAGTAMSYPLAPIDAAIDYATGKPIGTGHKERKEGIDWYRQQILHNKDDIGGDIAHALPEALFTKDIGGKKLLVNAAAQGGIEAVKAGIDQGDVGSAAARGTAAGAAGHLISRVVGGAKSGLEDSVRKLVDKGYVPTIGEMGGPVGKIYDATAKWIPGLKGAVERSESKAASSYNRIMTEEAAEKAAKINTANAASDAKAAADVAARNAAAGAGGTQAAADHSAEVARIRAANQAKLDAAKTAHEAALTKVRDENARRLALAREGHAGTVKNITDENKGLSQSVKAKHAEEVAKVAAENEARIASVKAAHQENLARVAAANEAKVAEATAAHEANVSGVTRTNEERLGEVNRLVQSVKGTPVSSVKEATSQIEEAHAKALAQVELPALARWTSTNKAVKDIREAVPGLSKENGEALNTFIKERVMNRGKNSLAPMSGKEAQAITDEIGDAIRAHDDPNMKKALTILQGRLREGLSPVKGALTDSVEQLNKAASAREALGRADLSPVPVPKAGKVELEPLPKHPPIEITPKPKAPDRPAMTPIPKATKPDLIPVPKAPPKPVLDDLPPRPPRVGQERAPRPTPKVSPEPIVPRTTTKHESSPVAMLAAGAGVAPLASKAIPIIASANPVAVAGLAGAATLGGAHQLVQSEAGRKVILKGLAGHIPDKVLKGISGLSGPEARKALESFMARPEFANAFASMGRQLSSGEQDAP